MGTKVSEELAGATFRVRWKKQPLLKRSFSVTKTHSVTFEKIVVSSTVGHKLNYVSIVMLKQQPE